MTALLIVGAVLVYLAIGALIARASLPQLWARSLNRWSERIARSDVLIGALFRLLLWPIAGPYELLLQSIDASNPKEIERRVKDQQKRIIELERELGMSR